MSRRIPTNTLTTWLRAAVCAGPLLALTVACTVQVTPDAALLKDLKKTPGPAGTAVPTPAGSALPVPSATPTPLPTPVPLPAGTPTADPQRVDDGRAKVRLTLADLAANVATPADVLGALRFSVRVEWALPGGVGTGMGPARTWSVAELRQGPATIEIENVRAGDVTLEVLAVDGLGKLQGQGRQAYKIGPGGTTLMPATLKLFDVRGKARALVTFDDATGAPRDCERFYVIDRDGSGGLDFEEFRPVYAQQDGGVGQAARGNRVLLTAQPMDQGPGPTPDPTYVAFRSVDANNNGDLDAAEFCGWTPPARP